MTTARATSKRHRHAARSWCWVFERGRAIGVIEQLRDGRWRALPMRSSSGVLGISRTRGGAIALVRREVER
jgi:hypothetical protein